MKKGNDAPLVKGGQGRTDDELYEDALYAMILVGALGLPILGVIIWRLVT